MSDQVVIAKIGKTHGIKGALKLYSFTEDLKSLLKDQQAFLRFPNRDWQPLGDVGLHPHGDGLLITFPDLTNPEDARRYVNAELGVLRDALPEPEAGQHYWIDLKGLSVKNLEGAYLGDIDHLFETGANDVMVLRGGDRERLLPYVKHVIIAVDFPSRQMVVDWGDDW